MNVKWEVFYRQLLQDGKFSSAGKSKEAVWKQKIKNESLLVKNTCISHPQGHSTINPGIGDYYKTKGFGQPRELYRIRPFTWEAQEWFLRAPKESFNSMTVLQAPTSLMKTFFLHGIKERADETAALGRSEMKEVANASKRCML